MKLIPKQLLKIIGDSSSILLLAHKHPDGDALGSLTALGRALKNMGKEVDYYIDSEHEDKLNFLPELKNAKSEDELQDSYDAIIYVDTSTLDYAYQPEKLPECKATAVIDHHRSNTGFTDADFIRVTGAAGELVWETIKALEAPVDDDIRDSIFTALSSDTGSFQFGNTVPSTHRAAAELLEGGRTFAPISKKLHSEKTYDQLRLYAKAVESIHLYDDDRIAFYGLDYRTIEDFGGTRMITDDISNIGMNIISVIVSAFVKETKPGFWRISLRSKSPYPIDVSAIAISYGGGGHYNAAGCSFEGSFEELQQSLLPKLEEAIAGMKTEADQ